MYHPRYHIVPLTYSWKETWKHAKHVSKSNNSHAKQPKVIMETVLLSVVFLRAKCKLGGSFDYFPSDKL